MIKDAIKELKNEIGEDNVLTSMFERVPRAMVKCLFPMHKWREYIPDAVVTPESTEDVVKIVKIANKYKIPLVPRSGGSGLADGALPLKRGIVVDLLKMNRIIEIDLDNCTATVEAGVSLDELGRELMKYGYVYPDYPASRHAAFVCARIATNGWSYLSGYYGHTEDLILSFEVVLPTGEVAKIGGGAGGKIRKSSSGYNLKSLFLGSQGTLGIITKATVEIFPAPEVEYPAYWGFKNFEDAYKALGLLQKSGVSCAGGWGLFDEKRVEFYRRDLDFYIDLPKDIKVVVFWWLYGNEDEVEVAARRLFKICENANGIFFGEDFSQTAWAARHETSVPPIHGRKNGQVVPMTWVMEDPAINYTEIPKLKVKWHNIIEKYGFDDWGLIFISNRRSKQGEYLAGIMIGVDETEFFENEKRWEDYIACRNELLSAALDAGGSLSAGHGAVEKGKVELIRRELGDEAFKLMLKIKKLLDPNNIMNPGKYMLDLAYGGDVLE